jgi:hypothetical protein
MGRNRLPFNAARRALVERMVELGDALIERSAPVGWTLRT